MVVAFVLVLGAAAAAVAPVTDPVPLRAPLEAFPMRIGSWTAAESQPFEAPIVSVLGVDDYINRLYTGPSVPDVGAYVGYYASQRNGATFHSPLNCLPGSGWQTVSTAPLAVPIDGRPPLRVNRMAVERGADRVLTLYWYQSHGRTTSSEYAAKLLTIANAIGRRQTDAAFVRVLTAYDDAPGAVDRAERVAVGFVEKMYPLLDAYLPS
jgi:EpsI family protein